MRNVREREAIRRIPLNLQAGFRFSNERLAVFGDFFGPFSNSVRNSLSDLIHVPVLFQRDKIQQKTFREYARSARYAVFSRVEGLDDAPIPVGMELEFPILYAMIDFVLGADESEPARETGAFALTRIEEKIAGRIMDVFRRHFVETWSRTGRWTFADTPPSPLAHDAEDGGFLAAEMVLALDFTLQFAGRTGLFTLYLPCAFAQFLMKDFEITNETSEILYETIPWTERTPRATGQTPEYALAGAQIQISVQFFGNKVRPDDILDWKVGDLIPLDMPEGTPFHVLIQGVPKLDASPGKYKNRIAFRIL